ncbi:MAG: hypothetical protein ACREP7_22390 [Lysobacter sp.]
MKLRYLSLMLATVLHASLASAAETAPKAKPVYGSFGVDLSARDTRVKPGDD